MIHSLGRLRALVVILGALPVGCRPDPAPPPVTNPSATVAVKVWAVLGSTEQLGNPDNWGCRMSEAEIQGFINQLIGTGWVFGGIGFWWPDGEPEIVRPGVVYRPMVAQDFEATVSNDSWRGYHLNIYFVGHVYAPPPVADLDGWTMEPDDPDQAGQYYIVINDGGGPTTEGDFLKLPEELMESHLLEHEVAHFFLRRSYCTPYDSHEHVPDDYGRHLLLPADPSFLELPESAMNQIMCRVWGDTWRDSSDTCGSDCPP